MLNKNYASDIRTCERIKFDQALYILTMYQKKIRKNRQQLYLNQNKQKGIDADQQLDDITYAWKNKWKMDLTKPILNCVTTVYPRILIDLRNQKNSKLNIFYVIFTKFIQRLRAEHEDQTNFKMVLNYYDKNTKIQPNQSLKPNVKQQENYKSQKKQIMFSQQNNLQKPKQLGKYLNCSKSAVRSILNVTYNMTNNCIKNFQQNYQYVINQDISDIDMQSLQWQVIRPLRFIRQIINRAIHGQSNNNDQHKIQEQKNQNILQTGSQQASQLVIFTNNTIKIMQKIKQSQHGSTLILVQPQIKQLTYIVHPMLVSIYANFKKQNLQKQKDFNWKQQSIPIQKQVFMENLKNSYNLSKIVFINLDGYQSQFNLQLARNFKKNLMYISFPKQQAIQNDLQKIYSKRFYKKLMFKYTQTPTNSNINQSDNLKYLSKLQQLSKNPQNYHYFAQKTYNNINQTSDKAQDLNQNMFIFPIRCKSLKQNFPQILNQSQKQDIQIHQSYFIRFIMKHFMINQIRQFIPSYVIVSYSGRLHIDDTHFVQLMQQLTKISNYKLLLYPNLTTGFIKEEQMEIQDNDGNQCDYDNFINDHKIKSYLNNYNQNILNQDKIINTNTQIDEQINQEDQQQINNNKSQQCSSILQLFNKVARFLKISSGTYNLSKISQQQALVSKFKNQFILVYADQIMTALGKQYYTIDRIRFKNKDLSIIPKLFEQNFNIMKKAFTKTVPQFYYQLYKLLQILLFQKDKLTKQQQDVIFSYQIKKQLYQKDLNDLWQQLTKSSTIQMYQIYKNERQFQNGQPQSNSHQQMKNQSQQLGNANINIVQQIQQIKIKKNKQRFYSLKQLHFIQISTQKLDQRVNIYIKKKPQNKQYQQISEQTQQTQGLYDVSFFRKDKTQIKLFQNTKILYKVDQQKRLTNNIPILIMNNLSDQKPNHFQNYISQINIEDELNKQRKNIQQKKTLAIPIILQDDQNINPNTSKSFIVKSEWNYHQTTKYLILFWPSEFNFLKAAIYKMLNKNYSPKIIDQIYIASKQSTQKHIFRKIKNILSDIPILPRMGCSCYQFQNRLFIFGGFYQKQKNYLNFQHDITMFNLQTYQQTLGNKMVIQNLKGTLYSQQNLHTQIYCNKNYNSFIRPKMQFQIFQKSQLTDLEQQNHQQKKVILFGGYGQNFLRPYSMLTYYYYQLGFEYESKTLSSVQKKIIYDKTVPVNIRQMTKNLGIIRTNKKNPNTNILQTNKLTEHNSYLSFRNSFKLQKSSQNKQQFKYKFRYMFAQDEYKTFKNQIKKVQQQRTQQFDSSTITVQKMQENNHLISLQKDGKKCVIGLHLQIPHEKAKKLGCSRQVKLTHQSIIHIDFWNSMICAVVKHDFYTKGKSVLVQYNIKSLQNLNFNHDQIPYIALTWIKQFQINLQMHILIACNKNTIAILHGRKLIQSDKLKQFIIKKKKNKSQAVTYDIHQKIYPELNSVKFQYCYSVFFKQRNKILVIQYLSSHNSSLIYQIAEQIQLNTANDSYLWQSVGQKIVNSTKVNVNNVNNNHKSLISVYNFVIGQNKISVPLQKIIFLDYFKFQRQQQSTDINKKNYVERIIQVIYNKQIYFIQLDILGNKKNYNHVQILELIPYNKLKIQKQNTQKGIILNKKIDLYYDFIQ